LSPGISHRGHLLAIGAVIAVVAALAGNSASAAEEASGGAAAAEVQMGQVTSQDGTLIAYERSGSGPLLIIVGHALATRENAVPLAGLFAGQFSVINYDRRGRGASTDTAPYTVQREVEDIEALIDAAGEPACLFGSSSGAVLALEAAARLPGKVRAAVLFEPPFIVDASRPPVPADFVAQVSRMVAEGRRGAAVEYFMTAAVLVPAEFVAQMKSGPNWAAMEALAHTLAYEGQLMGATQAGLPLPAERWSSARMPVLVLDGGASPPWQQHAAQALAELLSAAQYRSLPGLDHSAQYSAPDLLAAATTEFLQALASAEPAGAAGVQGDQ